MTMLSIRTFGSLVVSLDGEPLELPASRKTRALLAFLALSDHPQRRDRLCEFFWDIPNDPRGSLRWSLSKLRPICNAGGCVRLLTDRERVRIHPENITVDFHELRACASDDSLSAQALAPAWALSKEPLMEDCELPNQPNFMAWLQHQRNEVARQRIRLSRRLALSPELPAEEAQTWATRWLEEAPSDPRALQLVAMSQRQLGPGSPMLAPASDLKSGLRGGLARSDSPEPKARIAAGSGTGATEVSGAPVPKQVVRFVKASDQSALAWASAGAASHPPLVKAGTWLSHLELDWEGPIWSPLFQDLARTFRFIRYDERGCGLSDWDVPEITFETFVSDLERVVDTAGLERFPLLGICQAASVSIEYAARHPERVSHLILFGGFAAGWRHTATPEEIREREAVMVLTEEGWGRGDPSYRSLFSGNFMPDAAREELSWFDDFQRHATSARNAVRSLEAFSQIDVRERLKDVQAPTLVLHSRGDRRIPIATGRELAARIANAEFVSLDSNNHMLLGRERASHDFLRIVRQFLLRKGSPARG